MPPPLPSPRLPGRDIELNYSHQTAYIISMGSKTPINRLFQFAATGKASGKIVTELSIAQQKAQEFLEGQVQHIKAAEVTVSLASAQACKRRRVSTTGGPLAAAIAAPAG
eukprot:4044822-Pyramimonas_sp.AAC.1